MVVEHVNIADLSPGDNISDAVYYLKKMEEKKGGQGFYLVFADKSGTISATILQESFKDEYISMVGGAVKLKGFVDYRNGGPMIIVFSMEKPETDEIDKASLVKALTNEEKLFLQEELKSLIVKVEHPGYRTLLDFVFKEVNIDRMAELPATLTAEGCFCGGLLHKTVTVTEMAYEQAKVYERLRTEIFRCVSDIDYNLLISAGLLHAIGKIREYTSTIPFQKTEIGYYQGPRELTMQTIVACENMIKEKMVGAPEITALEHARLSSAILSMYRERGMHTITREGNILNSADSYYRNMDSHISAQLLAVERGETQGFVYDTRYGGYVENGKKEEQNDLEKGGESFE